MTSILYHFLCVCDLYTLESMDRTRGGVREMGGRPPEVYCKFGLEKFVCLLNDDASLSQVVVSNPSTDDG